MTPTKPLLLMSLLLAACASTAAPLDRGAPIAEVAGGVASDSSGRQRGPASPTAVERKLVRTGQISVTVDSYGAFRGELQTWLDDAGGYVADTHLSHVEGTVSRATLELRVPTERFDALVAWTAARVEVGSMALDTADVTEQWVDIDARLGNMQRTETRLAGLLETDASVLADVLAVERELARVRGEIESLEGRLRVLDDQVQLASLRVDLGARDAWTPTVSQPFGTQVAGAFTGSLGAMKTVAAGSVVVAAALAPWLAVALLVLAVLGATVRFAWALARGSHGR